MSPKHSLKMLIIISSGVPIFVFSYTHLIPMKYLIVETLLCSNFYLLQNIALGPTQNSQKNHQIEFKSQQAK